MRAEPVDSNSFRIRDSVAITAGTGCTPQGANAVVCSLASVAAVAFDLGDSNDSLSAYETYADGADAKVDAGGGAGDDTLALVGYQQSVSGGSGTDTVSADLEDLVARDCESVARPPGTPETREPTPVATPAPLVVQIARTGGGLAAQPAGTA